MRDFWTINDDDAFIKGYREGKVKDPFKDIIPPKPFIVPIKDHNEKSVGYNEEYEGSAFNLHISRDY